MYYSIQYVLIYFLSVNCVPSFVQPSKRFEKPCEVKTVYDTICIYSRDKCASQLSLQDLSILKDVPSLLSLTNEKLPWNYKLPKECVYLPGFHLHSNSKLQTDKRRLQIRHFMKSHKAKDTD
jgi:hypothetical protein